MRKFLFMLCLAYSVTVFGQAENQAIKEGNGKYENKDYTGAATEYKSALKTNPKSEPANYNLGNALFGQENFDTAIAQFSQVAEATADPAIRAQAYHNLGNAELMKKEYDKSVEAYKKSLRSNPNDMDTKYNLAYAQKKLEQQQQQQKQDQQKQDQKKDQENKDDQKKDQNKEDQNKQDQNKNQQNQQNKDQQQQDQAQQQPKKYSKEDMDRIMQALNNEDKQTQDKLNKQKMTPQKITIDKDW